MMSDDIVSPKSSEKLDKNEINKKDIYNNIINNIDEDMIKNNNNDLTFISEKIHPNIFNDDNVTSNSMILDIKINNNKINNEKNIITSFRNNIKIDILNSSFKTTPNEKNPIRNFTNLFSSNIIKRFLSEGNENNNEDHSIIVINENCLICDEKLTQQESIDNFIECFHIFCNGCYYEFIKEKVNNNFIEGIKCPHHDCQTKLFDDFIEQKLLRDIPTLDKYKKLQEKRQLMLNPNIQLCPFPDCDSYAIKEGNNKYVSCIKYNHKFCFNCLKDWHGEEKCDNLLDKSFEEWSNSSKVKRCPKCKYFIEKNKGCNHITCLNCRYQFCWLCMGKYTRNHFIYGRCSGLQFTENMIYSNKLIIFLRRFFIVLSRCFSIAFIIPFMWLYAFIYSMVDAFFTKNEFCKITFGISGTLIGLNLIVCSFPFTILAGFIFFLYWPLLDKILLMIDEYDEGENEND